MSINKLYPLTFEPLLKEVIWGGSAIRPFKGLTPDDKKVGESWEISHVDDNYSVVAAGPLAGKNLDELIHTYGEELVGKSVLERLAVASPCSSSSSMPATTSLSRCIPMMPSVSSVTIPSGKTEMWYVINATPGAKLYSGFAVQSSPEDYVRRIEEGTIVKALAEYEVNAGDVFFLPAGRVHANRCRLLHR